MTACRVGPMGVYRPLLWLAVPLAAAVAWLAIEVGPNAHYQPNPELLEAAIKGAGDIAGLIVGGKDGVYYHVNRADMGNRDFSKLIDVFEHVSRIEILEFDLYTMGGDLLLLAQSGENLPHVGLEVPVVLRGRQLRLPALPVDRNGASAVDHVEPARRRERRAVPDVVTPSPVHRSRCDG